jgi:hypothetical protein
MRLLTVAALLAAVFAGSSAFAQTGHVHHKYCLKSAGGVECAYDSIAQCKAGKSSPTDSCVRNSPTMNQH